MYVCMYIYIYIYSIAHLAQPCLAELGPARHRGLTL